MKHVKALALGLPLALGLANAHGYDVVKRYKLIDDKLKTDRMLSPIGHDFFIDISVAANKNVSDVIDDIKKAADYEGSSNDKLANANAVLDKYDKTEQSLKVNLGLGFPLPSFSIGQTNIKPNFRVLADIGANIGIRKTKLTNQDLVNLFKEDLPQDLKDLLLAINIPALNANDDLNTVCKAQPGANAALCDAYIPLGKYVVPAGGGDNPTATVYAKADVKAGFFNTWTNDKYFFGDFNLYGMGRADLYQYILGSQIASGDKIEMPDEINTEVTVQTDFKFGYKNSNYSLFAGIEELKIAQMKDRKEKSKEHEYGYDALIRLHGEALFRTDNFSIKPFAGVHKRSGYGFGDGGYVGMDLGTHVWGDRLGILLRGMADKQYLTLSPQLKLWLMQLEYSVKKPMKDMDDDVKLSVIHALDFRIFF